MTDLRCTQPWQQEVLAHHRWGQHGSTRAEEELEHLQPLWEAIQPVQEKVHRITSQILALEICNWRLEESLLVLCAAIGKNGLAEMAIGHYASITEERWKDVWRYYAALRGWLSSGPPDGYASLRAFFDPVGEEKERIARMLGRKDELKELYVERVCLCLERWLRGWLPWDSVLLGGHKAAVEKTEDAIGARDPNGEILDALRMDGDGRLQPCNHKAFRRYNIIVSSIGCGKWRGAMPECGTDGFRRADTLAQHLDPISEWIENGSSRASNHEMRSLLGERNSVKVFLASLLVSILRAQELAARNRAQSREKRT